MKTTIKYALSLLMLVAGMQLSGCKDDSSDNVSKEVKVTYPKIDLKGDAVVVILKGATYSESGAILTDDISGAKSDITPVSNTIDLTNAGIYGVSYKASNANGFETTAQRTVVVLDSAYTGTVNLAGSYKRSPNGAPVVITSYGQGVYVVDNVGGVPPPSVAVLPVVMLQTADDVIDIPLQDVPNGYGTLECVSEQVLNGGTQLKWAVRNVGFGPAVRTFNKQ